MAPRPNEQAQQPAHAGRAVARSKPSVAWPVCRSAWFGRLGLNSTPDPALALYGTDMSPNYHFANSFWLVRLLHLEQGGQAQGLPQSPALSASADQGAHGG